MEEKHPGAEVEGPLRCVSRLGGIEESVSKGQTRVSANLDELARTLPADEVVMRTGRA